MCDFNVLIRNNCRHRVSSFHSWLAMNSRISVFIWEIFRKFKWQIWDYWKKIKVSYKKFLSSVIIMMFSNAHKGNFEYPISYEIFSNRWSKILAVLVTVKNTPISDNFVVWKFCGTTQFPHSFGRIARNYAGTVPFHKIPTPGN